jgi:hypothetical protein
MSAKKYTKLVQKLGGEEIEDYYTSSQKINKLFKHFRDFDEKVEIITKILLSKNIEQSIIEKLARGISHKLK